MRTKHRIVRVIHPGHDVGCTESDLFRFGEVVLSVGGESSQISLKESALIEMRLPMDFC